MLDFSSANYLGFNHDIGSLPSRLSLTSGKPAALFRSPLQTHVENKLARLLNAKQAIVRRSTLHAFVDTYSRVRPDRQIILVDAGAYPVQKWAIRMAQGSGAVVRQFRHHDCESLARALATAGRRQRRAVVAADGFCTGCGRLTPISDYLELVCRFGGQLVLDDTQCTGILGDNPGVRSPWGQGGGGSHLYAGVSDDPNLTIVTSFAKGIAAPVAAIAGEATCLFSSNGVTEIHSSPATNADLAALDQALAINALYGDKLRQRLLKNIAVFRSELKRLGLKATGGLFPVQSISVLKDRALHIQRLLQAFGIRPILTEACCRQEVAVNLIITARHTSRDVKSAARFIHRALTRATTSRLAGSTPQLGHTFQLPQTNGFYRVTG